MAVTSGIIPLAKLDKLLTQKVISKEEYVENCNKFFSMKRQKYRDVYYKRKTKFQIEDRKNEKELSDLERKKEKLLEERSQLVREINMYNYIMRNNCYTLKP